MANQIRGIVYFNHFRFSTDVTDYTNIYSFSFAVIKKTFASIEFEMVESRRISAVFLLSLENRRNSTWQNGNGEFAIN